MGEITDEDVGAKSVLLILNGFSKFTLRVYRNGEMYRKIGSDSWDSIELTEGEDG